jgi:Sulfotransferase family
VSSALSAHRDRERLEGDRVSLPDFFIVGAPKAGTTALHEGLRRHPEIHLPARKDVPSPYVGSDLRFGRWQLSESEYLATLQPGTGEAIVGETCVWYLYSTRAAWEIARLRPDAQIVMVLRNPIEMIAGQHEQFLYNGNEVLERLEDALDAEEERARSRRIPRTAHFAAGLQYVATARYSAQVRRYLDVFPPEQVNVFLYEDLVADEAAVVNRIVERVGAGAFELRLTRANEAKYVRSKRLQRLLITPPPALERGYHRVVPERFHGRAAGWAIRQNVVARRRPSLAPHLRARLLGLLEDDIRELAVLIGRDLDRWLTIDA